MALDDPLARATGDAAAPMPPSVAAIHQTMKAVIEESQALRADAQKAAEERRRTNQVGATVAGIVLFLIVVVLVLLWQNNQQGRDLAELSRQNADTNQRMADCTTPGGKCYEESRKRTGGAIADVIRAQIFMAECARLWPGEYGPDYDRKLETCVAERLAGPGLRPSQ